MVVLSSCYKKETKLPNEQSKFVVTQIRINEESNGMSFYLVEPINKMNLNMNPTWFVDSVGKFNAGDTLIFQHHH